MFELYVVGASAFGLIASLYYVLDYLRKLPGEVKPHKGLVFVAYVLTAVLCAVFMPIVAYDLFKNKKKGAIQ